MTRATPTITWPAPLPINYGTPLSAAELDASCPLSGMFVYSPAAGRVLPSGLGEVLTVTFTPDDTTDYTTATDSTTINVLTSSPSSTPPMATTLPATAVAGTGAILNATVNPDGNATTVEFLYGADPTLTGGATATAADEVGAGTDDVNVSATLTGLTPDTKYYEQVVAISAGGTADGTILSFVTNSADGVASIQFAGTQFTANVTDGSAQIVLTRAGNLGSSVNVVLSSPGGADVATFQQTISFAPDTTTMAVAVPIENNGQPGAGTSSFLSRFLPPVLGRHSVLAAPLMS